eukprot:COSAG01_NODE_24267_length_784_cov_2.472993_1_plen_123_part_01
MPVPRWYRYKNRLSVGPTTYTTAVRRVRRVRVRSESVRVRSESAIIHHARGPRSPRTASTHVRQLAIHLADRTAAAGAHAAAVPWALLAAALWQAAAAAPHTQQWTLLATMMFRAVSVALIVG